MPRYLFRTYGLGTSGANSEYGFIPPAFRSYRGFIAAGHASVDLIPRQENRKMIEQHILWNYESRSEYSSWTVSLLWALQHAVRKQMDQKRSGMEICVLDVRKLIHPNIYPAKSLVEILEVTNAKVLRERYLYGEFLVHGKLKQGYCFHIISLDALIENGFFQTFPEFNNPNSWRLLDL